MLIVQYQIGALSKTYRVIAPGKERCIATLTNDKACSVGSEDSHICVLVIFVSV